MKAALAFDTSNYTTSCAVFDGATGRNAGRLLHVERGKLGLRQSEALFAHVKQLPEVFSELKYEGEVLAVGASAKPRETLDSYMPCFLAGASQGRVLAQALGVPFFAFSHQQGHIAAAAWSAGRLDLLDIPHLAWQIPAGDGAARARGRGGKVRNIGARRTSPPGSSSTGRAASESVSAGKELDALRQSESTSLTSRSSTGLLSLSGVEHGWGSSGVRRAAADVAFALRSLVSVLRRVTERA